MSAADHLASVLGLSWSQLASWPGFVAGLLFGSCAGAFGAWLVSLGTKRAGRRAGRAMRAMLTLAPAFVACLLWGAFLGILAARHFGH